jgi:glycosyltransferase involved in cell wall biosynthesis
MNQGTRARNSMKILFVNNFRGRGGGEEFLRDLLPGLVAKGIKVGLICRPRTPLMEMFKNSPIELYPIDRSGWSGLTSVVRTAKIIRDGQYDIIDIQRGHDIVQSWIGARLSRRRPALIYTPQVPEFIRSRLLLSLMDRIVTISRHIRDRIIDFYPGAGQRTSILYYGIDLDKFREGTVRRGWLRQRFGLPEHAPIIGTVGDLWKNQIEFLDALLLIRKRFPEARFALVAAPSGIGQVQQFKARAAELGLSDAILWVGRLAKEDMYSFYADIDLAVCTHRNEGFGIWVLEALSMGAPVVAFNAGGVRDSLEGCPAGSLVGQAKDMAEKIIEILADKALRKQMSEAGPKWVAGRYARQRMIDDYYDFFAALLNERTGSRQ